MWFLCARSLLSGVGMHSIFIIFFSFHLFYATHTFWLTQSCCASSISHQNQIVSRSFFVHRWVFPQFMYGFVILFLFPFLSFDLLLVNISWIGFLTHMCQPIDPYIVKFIFGSFSMVGCRLGLPITKWSNWPTWNIMNYQWTTDSRWAYRHHPLDFACCAHLVFQLWY